jgi:DNA-binding transcriptional ArsR family regulator
MNQSVSVNSELPIEALTLKKSALIFRAMNHPLRQNMLRLLHNKGEMTVTQIYTELGLEQSVASQHLAILRNVGLVNTERNGKSIIYSVNHNRIEQIHQVAGKLLNTAGL